MSKPLSEQVAELEATVGRQEKQIVWLDTERERLAAENAELREGSDALWEVAKHATIPSEHIRIKTPPRLTVHKLNVAPDGSKLDAKPFRGVFRKLDGNWVNQQGTLRAPEYIINEYPDATIAYPEDEL